MRFDPTGHRRQSLRLPGHDYSQPGAYFVTICTRNHECLLGSVSAGWVELSEVGRYVREEWAAMPERFSTVEMDAFVVMPNHLHGIIVIKPVGALLAAPRSENGGDAASSAEGAASSAPTLGDIVLAHIREYIALNPTQWDIDRENPQMQEEEGAK